MKTFLIKEADLQNVGQNNLGSLSIATKFNHHGLMLNFLKSDGSACTQANIEADVDWVNIDLKLRGGPNITLLKKIPASVIFALLNKYREAAKTSYTYTGCMYIPFARPELNQFIDPMALVLGMADVDNYILNVKFKNVVLNCAKVEVIPEVDKGAERPLGEHVRVERWERLFSSTGVETIHNLPFGIPQTGLLAYHVGLGSGAINNIEVEADGELLHNPLTAVQNNFLLHKCGRVPQSGFMSVDFNRKGGALPIGTFKSFYQRINWGTAPVNYDIYTEMVYGMGNKNY